MVAYLALKKKLNFLNHLWKPTIMKPLKYEDKEYEILIQNHVFIKDKKTNSYYRNNMNSIDEKMLKKFNSYPEKVNCFLFFTYMLLSVIVIITNILYTLYLQKNIIIIFENEVTVVLILYFLVSVFLHELGHIYSLKFFGRKIDKFGFRLNFYVFPSFYVQMNETYMLSKIDKIIVHSFGLFINIISINLLQLMNILIIDSYALTVAYMFFSSTLLWNLVPILNSDGYKIMMVALSLDEFNNFTKNHWLILIFQTIGVVIALNTIIHWVFYWIKNISI